MKKLITLILAVCVLAPLGTFAQSKTIADFFKKYEDDKNVKSVSINFSGFSINLGSDAEAEGIENMIDQIEHIKVLSIEDDHEDFDKTALWDELHKIIKKKNYVQLVDVRSGDEKVAVYVIQQDENVIKEGLVVAIEDDEAAVISVTGSMVPADFMNMHKSFGHWGHKHHHKHSKHDHDHDHDKDDGK